MRKMFLCRGSSAVLTTFWDQLIDAFIKLIKYVHQSIFLNVVLIFLLWYRTVVCFFIHKFHGLFTRFYLVYLFYYFDI